MELIFGSIASNNKTRLHRCDAKLKIIALVSFAILTSVIQSLPVLSFLTVLVLGMIIWTGLSGWVLCTRLIWLAPFAVMLIVIYPFSIPGNTLFQLGVGSLRLTATTTGLVQAAVLLLRVTTAVLAGTVLTATTSFPDLMKALRELKVPGIMVSLLEFTVRYIYVLTDEVQRMHLARKARGFSVGKSLLDRRSLRTLGLLIGVLFVRSLERGERVYQAMLSRGYTGE